MRTLIAYVLICGRKCIFKRETNVIQIRYCMTYKCIVSLKKEFYLWTLLVVMSERGVLWVDELDKILETFDDVPNWVLMIGEQFCVFLLCLVFFGRMGISRGFLRGRPGASLGVTMFPVSETILLLGCCVNKLFRKGVKPDEKKWKCIQKNII